MSRTRRARTALAVASVANAQPNAGSLPHPVMLTILPK